MERFLEILKTLDVLARMSRKLQTSLLDFGDWSVEVEDRRKLPDVVAYKVPVMEFTDKDKDTSCASKWLFHAWGVDHPLSVAYGYRIARATGFTFDNTESVVASLKLMALSDSRTALEDLAIVSKDEYKETTKIIRNGLSGTGANHSSEEEMLHGFRYGMWIKTFENIPIILENFSRLPHITDYTINKRGDRILHMAEHGMESPLHWLISFDDEEVERVYPGLIQPGADTTAKTSTIIAYQADFPAAAVPDRLLRGYAIGWVEQLLDHGAAFDGLPDHFHTTESPLLIVVQNDAFHLADSLVSHGADLNFTTLSCSHLTLSNPTTILGHVIASDARSSIARLRYLLGSPLMRDGLHLIVGPARQRSALHRAAAAHIDVEFHGTDAAEAAELHWADVDWSANREIMNEILRHFNGPEQLNAVETSTGLSPMHLAVLAGNEAAVSLLLDHGARSDVPSVGGQGATAADTALGIQMGGLSMIEEIGRPGREEVAARKQCSNLLNPATQSAAQAQPALA
ncbi:Ankyrin repeat [Fusarium oxysporum f. sp. vasinfectum]|nr:Ankyrin repeat [Fusarium oxysporum f. sp. vasinfectum]